MRAIKWIGGIWAVIGGGNIVMLPWTEWGELALALGVIFNAVLFVLPGLILYAVAERREPKGDTPSTE